MKAGMKTGRKIGAMLGGIFFVIFGIVPGFYFGTTGALVTLSHLMGHAAEPTVIARLMMVVGGALGIFCTGAVSIVLGSVGGTALGYVSDMIGAEAPEAEKATDAIK